MSAVPKRGWAQVISPDLLAVLRAIHVHAPINRVELARRLGDTRAKMPGMADKLSTPIATAVAELMRCGLVKGTSYVGDVCATNAGAELLGEQPRGGEQIRPPYVTQPRLIAGLCNNGLVTHRRRLG